MLIYPKLNVICYINTLKSEGGRNMLFDRMQLDKKQQRKGSVKKNISMLVIVFMLFSILSPAAVLAGDTGVGEVLDTTQDTIILAEEYPTNDITLELGLDFEEVLEEYEIYEELASTEQAVSIQPFSSVYVSDAAGIINAINNANGEATTIVLLNDITTTATIAIPVGEDITFAGDYAIITSGNHAVVTVNGTFTLNGSTLTRTGAADTDTRGVFVSDSGIFIMKGGKIIGNKAISGGGVKNEGRFEMGGGLIHDNLAHYGGGVWNEGMFEIRDEGDIVGNTANWAGGGVWNTGYFEIHGGIISENTVPFDLMTDPHPLGGGGVWNDGNFKIYEGRISNNSAINGGGVWNIGYFTFYEGRISNNSAINGGGVWSGAVWAAGVWHGGHFEMYDGIISGNKADIEGGGIAVMYSTFTMRNGIIADNMAKYAAGGISLGFRATGIMKNGTIKGNETGGFGGGVAVSDEGVFSMKGNAEIYNNHANNGYGGGLHVSEDSIFNMSDNSSIKSNAACYSGGGVYIRGSGSVFTMNGGEISDNIAGTEGGGVMMESGVVFNMHGDAMVYDNHSEYAGGGLALRSGSKLYMNDYAMVYDNQTKGIGGGVYVFDAATVIMSDNSRIEGNRSSYDGGGVLIGEYARFYMLGNAAIYNNYADGNGGGVYMRDLFFVWTSWGNSYIQMEDNAMIYNNHANGSGGGLYIGDFGTLTISDSSSIEGNISAKDGGGVALQENSEFQMNNNAAIYSNHAGGNGGGVYMRDQSTFTMSGNSSIEENISANGSGGGVFVGNRSHFAFMDDYSRIKGNIAYHHGGGVMLYQSSNSLHVIRNGSIEGNRAGGNGGGVYVGIDAAFEISCDARIYGNDAGGNGGGIYAFHDGGEAPASVRMRDTSIISNNIANNGGGVYVHHSLLYRIEIREDVVFTGNVAREGVRIDTPLAIANADNIRPGEVSLSRWIEKIGGELVLVDSSTNPSAHAFNNYDINAIGPEFFPVTYSIFGSDRGTITAAVTDTNVNVPNDTLVPEGTSITFTATPGVGDEVSFWTVNGEIVIGTEAQASTITRTVTAGELDVVVRFNLFLPAIVAFTAGANGSVAATVNGNPIESISGHRPGTEVVFIATPYTGYQVASWMVNGEIVTGVEAQAPTITREVPEAGLDVVVTFEAVSQNYHNITVNTQGNGTASANVSSAQQGAEITLTAAANAGYAFKEWQVVSGGIVLSSTTATTATFTMPNNAVEILAVFEEIQQLYLTVNVVVRSVDGTENPLQTAVLTFDSVTQGPTSTFTLNVDGSSIGNTIMVEAPGFATYTHTITSDDLELPRVITIVFKDLTPPPPGDLIVNIVDSEGNRIAATLTHPTATIIPGEYPGKFIIQNPGAYIGSNLTASAVGFYSVTHTITAYNVYDGRIYITKVATTIPTDNVTVTFNLQSGNIGGNAANIVVSDVVYGTSVGNRMPSNPTKLGHIFEGWVDNGGNPFTATTLVYDNKTVFAQWMIELPQPYLTVTFDLQGGNIGGSEDNIMVSGVLYETSLGTNRMPVNPEKTGYVFEGWVDGEGNPFTATTLVYGNKTVFAQWQEVLKERRYTVTFNLQGGNIAGYTDNIVVSEVVYGTSLGYRMPANPTRSGHTFAGWNTADDGSGTAFDGTTPIAGDITLHAQWTRNNVGGGGGGGARLPATTPGDADEPVEEERTLPRFVVAFTEDHIAYLVGFPDGTIRPNTVITRAEVATIFFRLLEDSHRTQIWSQTNPFSDVTSNDWFNNAVSTLTGADILEGFPDGTFRGNQAVTRAEFVTIIARFVENPGYEGEDMFNDISDHWAREAINIAGYFGWTSIFGDDNFRPNRNITRAEATAIINRMLNRQLESTEDLLPDMITWSDNTNQNAWFYLDIQEATNSHNFEIKEGGVYERWTEIRAPRNWTLLERSDSRPYDIL